jgi:hypothetical protein
MKIELILWSRGRMLRRVIPGWRNTLRALRLRDGCGYCLHRVPDDFAARMRVFAAQPCACNPAPKTMQEGEPCRACTAAGVLAQS